MNLKRLASDVFWGVSAAVLALLLRWALDPILGGKYPYVTVFVLITLTAWHAGPRAAVFMLVLCFPAAQYFFVAPRGDFIFDFDEDAAGFVMNSISAAIIIALGAYARRKSMALDLANQGLVSSNQRLADKNEEVVRINEELRAANEELRMAHELVAEMSERKDQFLTTLSHELRNPMSAIVTAAQMLKLSKSGDENSANAIGILDRQSRQMKGLLDDLLDKRRIALGKFELKRERVDVRACVHDGIESHRPLVYVKKQRLKVSVPATPVHAVVDARRVTQMVANLVGNAVKHTNSLTEIDVSLSETNGRFVLSVRDNGQGIPRNVMPHLFEPFHPKKGSPHSAGDGLGIGLTLTKGLVEMHGGTITVTSSGDGTTFIVKLPTNLTDGVKTKIPLSSV